MPFPRAFQQCPAQAAIMMLLVGFSKRYFACLGTMSKYSPDFENQPNLFKWTLSDFIISIQSSSICCSPSCSTYTGTISPNLADYAYHCRVLSGVCELKGHLPLCLDCQLPLCTSTLMGALPLSKFIVAFLIWWVRPFNFRFSSTGSLIALFANTCNSRSYKALLNSAKLGYFSDKLKILVCRLCSLVAIDACNKSVS